MTAPAAAETPPATARPAPLWAAAGGWRGAGVAVGLYAATRLVQLLFVDWLGADERGGVRERLLIWDAGWFLRIVTDGYPAGFSYGANGAVEGSSLAFFPLYPYTVKAVTVLTGLGPENAALVVSWLAGAAAAVALHLLGTTLYGRRAGWALVVLCCAQPLSVVLSMAYSEALFLALVAGMLVAAHRRVWWAAGLLGLGAALTRPTGAAAAVALAVAVALIWREAGRAERWQAGAAAVAALAGVPLFLGWVALRAGSPDAWFTIQTAGWGTSFDAGASTLRFLGGALGGGDGFVPITVAFLLLLATVLMVVALRTRPWLPLAVYGVLAFVLVVGQAGFYHSKPRLLLPVLLVLVPPVLAAARARPRVAAWALTAYSLVGLWYGAYMLDVWPYTI
ncbi:hypothetical protein [Spirilliplanes yamanashiensis]|uniref:Membrane protein n=1 Tax=Spirilliplanes yamanashiensis TaxID=42233 RepID=A0A8J3Y4P8_9ACTN|nr:hypothetical protein [Spirilliplanes yamanashiensis]MDP9819736.1 4-amino-4-deoxy-L-arabinose transferase-like glycosyltransferase [Spirilliplanes yamanashiensis]GIJ01444.1 membrane protein [Spirilliplanes yamanashiensis]